MLRLSRALCIHNIEAFSMLILSISSASMRATAHAKAFFSMTRRIFCRYHLNEDIRNLLPTLLLRQIRDLQGNLCLPRRNLLLCNLLCRTAVDYYRFFSLSINDICSATRCPSIADDVIPPE